MHNYLAVTSSCPIIFVCSLIFLHTNTLRFLVINKLPVSRHFFQERAFAMNLLQRLVRQINHYEHENQQFSMMLRISIKTGCLLSLKRRDYCGISKLGITVEFLLYKFQTRQIHTWNKLMTIRNNLFEICWTPGDPAAVWTSSESTGFLERETNTRRSQPALLCVWPSGLNCISL